MSSSRGAWREAVRHGQVYFYHSLTHETSWHRPPPEQMEPLPPPPPGEPPPAAAAAAADPPPADADAYAPHFAPHFGAYVPFAAPPAAPYGLPPAAYGAAELAAAPPFTPVLAPPPKPPPMLHPQQLEPPPLPPQPGQEEFYRRPDNWPGRSYHKSLGESIHRLQETPGNIRHDVIIEKRVIGRILGKGARDLDAMKAYSGAEVFIIDKHPPPGEGDEHRLLILIGTPSQVRACKEKVDVVLERARNELPPLPPPLSSGWRPVPEVGNPEQWDDGQRHLAEPSAKKQRY